MKADIAQLWVYLQQTPLLGLGATLIAYQIGLFVNHRLHGSTFGNPMLVAIVLLVALLLATGTPYPVYFQGGQYVQFLLGPATVALAVPMHANLHHIRRTAHAILPALIAGSVTACVAAMLIARAMGAPREIILSLAPKSVTTPIAMGIAEQIGGQPSLAAVFVLLTGICAVIMILPLTARLGIRDQRAIGLAAGTSGHGLATARVLPLNETAGAFGGLAIGINGVVTAIMVPFLARWILG